MVASSLVARDSANLSTPPYRETRNSEKLTALTRLRQDYQELLHKCHQQDLCIKALDKQLTNYNEYIKKLELKLVVRKRKREESGDPVNPDPE